MWALKCRAWLWVHAAAPLHLLESLAARSWLADRVCQMRKWLVLVLVLERTEEHHPCNWVQKQVSVWNRAIRWRTKGQFRYGGKQPGLTHLIVLVCFKIKTVITTNKTKCRTRSGLIYWALNKENVIRWLSEGPDDFFQYKIIKICFSFTMLNDFM